MSGVQRRSHAVQDFSSAIILAVGICLGMGAVLKPKPRPVLPDPAKADLAMVEMLPLDDIRYPYQKGLVAWLSVMDPTVLTLPDEVLGFSVIRSTEFDRPVKTLPVQEMLTAFVAPWLAPEETLTAPRAPLLAQLMAAELAAAPVVPAPPPGPVPAPGVYWMDATGAALPEHPVIGDDEIQTVAATAPVVNSPTRVRLVNLKDSVSVELVRSCGNDALDRLVLWHLRRYFLSGRVQLDVADFQHNWVQRWPAIQVEWRFVEGVVRSDRAADIHKDWPDERWHDLDWY